MGVLSRSNLLNIDCESIRRLLKTLYSFCISEIGRNVIFRGQSLSILVKNLENPDQKASIRVVKVEVFI